MSDLPQKRASVRLRVREKLKGVSLIYAISMRKLAVELTDKANLDGLFAWCKQQGAGVDGFALAHLPGGSQGEAWLDGRRQRGVFVDRIGNVTGTLVDGQVKGDPTWAEWLAVLPPTGPAEWGSAAAAKGAANPAGATAAPKPAADTKSPKPAADTKETSLGAKVDLELSSRAQVDKLSEVRRQQLEAASKGLCGKKGLAALVKWCDAERQGLAHVVVSAGKVARYEGWLAAALEDGVFFDAGQTKPNGLVVSQADVHASVTARQGEVAALQKAMAGLKAPRAPKWKG